MVEFILFVLLLGVWVHSLNTRNKLQNMANLIDRVHVAIDKSLTKHTERLDKLERKNHKKI